VHALASGGCREQLRALVRCGPGTRWTWQGAWFLVPLAWCPVVAVLRPGDATEALARTHALLSWQRAIGLAPEEAAHRWWSERPVLAALATAFYFGAHLSAVVGVACWTAARHRAVFLRLRATFAVAQLLTIAVYLAVPVAPPRLLLGGPAAAAAPGWARSVQYELAAMPSGHVVFALVVGVAAWETGTRVGRVLGPVHVALTLLVVVVTGHHLLADAAGAAAVVAVAVLLVRRLLGWLTAGDRARA
jgi:hypothetical protein